MIYYNIRRDVITAGGRPDAGTVMLHDRLGHVKHVERLANKPTLVSAYKYALTHGLKKPLVQRFCTSSLGRYFGAVAVGVDGFKYFLPATTPPATLNLLAAKNKEVSLKYIVLALLETNEVLARSTISGIGYSPNHIRVIVRRLKNEGLVHVLPDGKLQAVKLPLDYRTEPCYSSEATA